jgi:PAS domain S-box-containing protein
MMDNEVMFKVFFEKAPDAIFAIEKDGTIVTASNKAMELFGYEKNSLIGTTIESLMPNGFADVHKKHRMAFAQKPETREMGKGLDLLAKRKDGTLFFAEISISPIHFDDREIVLASVRDVSEKKDLYNQLEESNEQFKGAFKYSAVGMGLVSTEGKWLEVNKSICDILGYTNDELLASTFQDITHPDDLDLDLEHVGKMLRGEIESYQMEKRYYHKNGSIVWVLLSVSLSKDVKGKPLHFVSQVRDITDRKVREQTMQHSIDIISKQNLHLMNFAHIVSHNLRSHTSNFQLLVNMLEKDEDDREYVLGLLKDNAQTLSETIAHLNEVVQIQTNPNIKRETIYLAEYIDKTIDVLAGEINLHNAIVKNNVPSSVFLSYNPAYLESIVLNFLSNGIKYRHENRAPKIEFNASGKGVNLMLEIIDNGVGINLARNREKLFGLYKTFHRNSDARGVGLFITKNQVEVMGGKIEVESEVGKGTTFRIYFNQTNTKGTA